MDASLALPQHRQGVLDAEELAVDVDVERRLPRRGVQGLDRTGGPGDAGVVDQDVQAAQFLPDGGHEGPDLLIRPRRR